MTHASPATSYDEVPYLSLPFAQTHPDRLCSIATLLGVPAPEVGGCRVLELGCAAGGNLIPMAADMPGGHFIGIDLSLRQIAEGRRRVEQLALKNIELRHMSISDITPALGLFDYIIAHGVYTWIPPAVKEALLRCCNENLAPNGVAYVSYNTFPGWHMRGSIRDMMRYHTQRIADPLEKIKQARGLLNFLAKSVPPQAGAYSALLNEEAKSISRAADHYLLHEHLEEVNEPLYFHEFVERAGRHGLQYLSEAVFAASSDTYVPQEIVKTLSGLAHDVVSYEQYLDFVRNRTFRQTLLVHTDVSVRRNLNWQSVHSFYISAGQSLRADTAKPDVRSTKVEKFVGLGNATISISVPVVKAAMALLVEQTPMNIKFADLLERATKISGAATSAVSDEHAKQLGVALLQAYATGLVDLSLRSTRFSIDAAGLRPKASPLARLQAESAPLVTSMLHKSVQLDEIKRQILTRLDGTTDRQTIAEAIRTLNESGALSLADAGSKTTKARFESIVDSAIADFARLALLVE